MLTHLEIYNSSLFNYILIIVKFNHNQILNELVRPKSDQLCLPYTLTNAHPKATPFFLFFTCLLEAPPTLQQLSSDFFTKFKAQAAQLLP